MIINGRKVFVSDGRSEQRPLDPSRMVATVSMQNGHCKLHLESTELPDWWLTIILTDEDLALLNDQRLIKST